MCARKPPWVSFAIAVALGMLVSTAVRAQYLKTTWQDVEWGEYLGSNGLWDGDLDGNGTEEIVFSGINYGRGYYTPSAHFFVLNHQGDAYVARFTSPAYSNSGISYVAVGNPDGDNDQDIYVLLPDGRIDVYDGSSLNPIDTLITNSATNSTQGSKMLIEDVDGDGSEELIIGLLRGDGFLHVYDAQTQALEWDTTGQIKDFEIGDVDGDGRKEIVLGSGMILDGATHSVEWKYGDGFGGILELANIDDDPALEILTYSDDYYAIFAFDGQYRTPLWQMDLNSNSSALLVRDIDGDGDAEIAVGSSYGAPLMIYDANTRETEASIEGPGYGTTNIAVGDPDSDGAPEIIWGGGQFSSGSDNLYVADVQTQEIEWQSQDVDGPYMVQLFDVNGDDSLEIVTAAQSSNSGYDAGVTTVFSGRN